jgi:hypothetical protein
MKGEYYFMIEEDLPKKTFSLICLQILEVFLHFF